MAALRTPLYDWHVARGGRMVEFAGWDMPVQFAGVIAEHQAVRASAGLFDISHMGRLSFGGPGAEALIQLVWTNDARSMEDGQVRYGLICNDAGGIRDDVLVYRWPYGWAMVVNASNRTKIVDHLEAAKIGRGAGPCGLGGRDTLRLEAAMPLYGHELNEEIDPFHAGLAWAVKLQKGDFIGRAAVAKAQETPGRQRVGLVLQGKRAAREGCAVILGDGQPVGVISSGSFTPTLQKSIAMAYVDGPQAAVGTKVSVNVRGKI